MTDKDSFRMDDLEIRAERRGGGCFGGDGKIN